ncbi:hypothetical protein PFICI_02499 [Pestalotiopsis fici W106-1]|uniref:DUF7908 domain-containing protein n=1 Tax=Pestalotiopsis fici (strain W106-1 / CGMCC3.15140) TaxID=1229662 RepID=W3XEN2_PESFW|nr:uncharacterized protein PFICI_02499 [Pestalotiopsis fici W106-1]ETS84474.1 hypothetical protein PFICI_02499 [Pestalotiopsis fici W106-1]
MVRNRWALLLPGLLGLALAACSDSSCLERLENCGPGCVADCSRWLAVTVTPATITSTITVQSSTTTATGLARRQESQDNQGLCPPPPFPPYAGAVCNDLSEYVSACSCIGAGPTTTTVAVPTTTVTVTADGILNPTISGVTSTTSGSNPTTSTSTLIPTGASAETSAASTTSDSPIILTVAPVIQPAVQTPAPGKRWLRRQTPTESEPPVGGFIGADSSDSGCASAQEFTIVDGELTGQGGSLRADIDASFTEFVPSSGGTISRTFVVINSTLHWQNETFSGGEAGFCQSSDGVVYATFRDAESDLPVDCSPISIVVYRANRCVNGVIVPDPDQSITSSDSMTASSSSSDSMVASSFEPSSAFTSPSTIISVTSSSSIISSSTLPSLNNFTSSTGFAPSGTGPLSTALSGIFPSSTFASSTAPYSNLTSSTVSADTASSTATPSIIPQPPLFGFCLQVDGRNSSLDKQFVTSEGLGDGLYLEAKGTSSRSPVKFTLNPITGALSTSDGSYVTISGCPEPDAEFVSFSIETADAVNAAPGDFILVTCSPRYSPVMSAFELQCSADSGESNYGPFTGTGTDPVELSMLREDGSDLSQSVTLVLRSGAECALNTSEPTVTSMTSTTIPSSVASETASQSPLDSFESLPTSVESIPTTFLSETSSETSTSVMLNPSDATPTDITSSSPSISSITPSETGAQSSVTSSEAGSTLIEETPTASSSIFPSETSTTSPGIWDPSDPPSTPMISIPSSASSTVSSETETTSTSSESIVSSTEDITPSSSTISSETITSITTIEIV